MFNLGEHIRAYVEEKGINLSVAQLSKLDDNVYSALSETGLDEIIDEAMKDMMAVDGIIQKDEPEVDDRVQLVSSDHMLKTGLIVSMERWFTPFDTEKSEFRPLPYNTYDPRKWGTSESGVSNYRDVNIPCEIDGDTMNVSHPAGLWVLKHDGYAYFVKIDGVEEPMLFLREHFNVVKN